MNNTIKLILALLLFLCLLDMPYGYFQLIRFVAMSGFIFLAYDARELQRSKKAYIYIVLAALFQPFIKVSFGRAIWNIMLPPIVRTINH